MDSEGIIFDVAKHLEKKQWLDVWPSGGVVSHEKEEEEEEDYYAQMKKLCLLLTGKPHSNAIALGNITYLSEHACVDAVMMLLSQSEEFSTPPNQTCPELAK
tara:strand:- start:1785 stop:2090 length:306 start_codon:yes stop_codon:yes gene_type:complete